MNDQIASLFAFLGSAAAVRQYRFLAKGGGIRPSMYVRGRGHRITDEEKEGIIEDYKKLVSVPAIAGNLGCGETTVLRILKKEGIYDRRRDMPFVKSAKLGLPQTKTVRIK